MSSTALIRQQDLANNPVPRVPVCLCLDTSGSMEGDPINELNQGVKLFYDAIRDDDVAIYSAEICIITFGMNVQCVSEFATLAIEPNPPLLSAYGGTPMGEAVNMALDRLEARKKEYQSSGVDYYQPWLVLMTDGQPNGDYNELLRATQRTTEMINNRKLTIFPIGIGREADMNVLQEFSPKRTPLRLQGLKFREFFAWLSQSVSRTSQSSPNEAIKIDINEIKGWSELEL